MGKVEVEATSAVYESGARVFVAITLVFKRAAGSVAGVGALIEPRLPEIVGLSEAITSAWSQVNHG